MTDAVPLAPRFTLTEVGETPMLKSGVPGAVFTVRLSEVLWLRLPEIPVIVRVKVPTVADAEAAIVKVEVALPPDAGVTLTGENEAVTPLGRPEMLRLVALLKPLRLATVTVAFPLVP